MSTYILAHDLGTTGNKATLYDDQGRLCASITHAYETKCPHEKWVEQNPQDWWKAVCCSTKNLLENSQIAPQDIACISFSAQMMGCLLIDKSGEPIRDMITWADSRADQQEKAMINRVGLQRGYQITGHRLSASYSAAKLLWIKENEKNNYDRAYKMIHAKDYIIFKLTGKILSDYSDASSTNLLDIEKKIWSDELLEAFDIRKDLLPDIFPSTDIAGYVHAQASQLCGLLEGTPVVIGGGDGSCACVGAGVNHAGKAYNVIGTSSWISYADSKPYFDEHMRTFNWVHLDPKLYTPCGTMQAAGFSYNWYKNVLCETESQLAKTSDKNVYDILNEEVIKSEIGANGLLFLPYLVGERSPIWNLQARAAFIGMGANTAKKDMTRAVLEGVGFNLRMILDAFSSHVQLDDIIMIGGGVKGRVWVEILSSIWQKTLYIPQYIDEATSMGAAICGGVGIGLFDSFQSCENFNPAIVEIKPDPAKKERYDQLYSIFKDGYEGLIPVYNALSKYRTTYSS